jgi:rubrerythrin
MSAVEALKLALSKEINSIKLYQDLSNKHPEIRELLSFLLTEEEKHKKMLEGKIYELTK